MAELAEAATEVVADVAEEVAENATEVAEAARAMNPGNVKFLMMGLGIGLVGGAVAGGAFVNRRLRLKYQQFAEEEISEMREHFRKRLIAKEEKPDLEELAESKEIVKRKGYDGPATPTTEVQDGAEARRSGEVEASEEVVSEEVEVEVEEEVSPEEVRNLFEETKKDADEEWDQEHEENSREPTKPYIIHYDERHQRGYTETTLTYYEGDDVVCDERENPIEDPDQVIGSDFLDKFGHGSRDKNIVYIRNDSLGVEVEVLRNDGSYAEVVHGLPPIQHSDDAHRRTRFDDEPDSS